MENTPRVEGAGSAILGPAHASTLSFALLIAFRTSGRLSVTVAMESRRVSSRVSI